MEPIVINSTELRLRAREIMERVKYRQDRFLVQTFGKPMAMIINIEDYLAMCAEMEQLKSTRLNSGTEADHRT